VSVEASSLWMCDLWGSVDRLALVDGFLEGLRYGAPAGQLVKGCLEISVP
jgi:hypothetical protein